MKKESTRLNNSCIYSLSWDFCWAWFQELTAGGCTTQFHRLKLNLVQKVGDDFYNRYYVRQLYANFFQIFPTYEEAWGCQPGVTQEFIMFSEIPL